MEAKTGMSGLKERGFGIGSNKVDVSIKPTCAEFMVYRDDAEGYYKIVLSKDATIRLVGGSTQRDNLLVGGIQLEEKEYTYIVSTIDDKLAFWRALITVKRLLKEFHNGFDSAMGLNDPDEMNRLAISSDIHRISGFILDCKRD